MAYRTASMSSDYLSGEPSHLFRNLVLSFLFGIAAAAGMVFLFRQKPDFPILLFTFFADVSLGVVAGFSIRTLIGDHGWFTQGAAAAAIVVVGLGLLGYFTNWKTGIGPLEFGRTTVDWLSLTQMFIGIDVSWMALRAWQLPPIEAIEPAPRAVSRPRRKRPAVAAPRIQLPRSWSLWPKPRPKVRTRSRSGTRTAAAAPRAASRAPVLTFTKAEAVRPKRRSGVFRRQPQVQLALVEEHRCPYCLDPVSRNDPRGVKECEVCHTWHHADCWAITGTCQVPHLNT